MVFSSAPQVAEASLICVVFELNLSALQFSACRCSEGAYDVTLDAHMCMCSHFWFFLLKLMWS